MIVSGVIRQYQEPALSAPYARLKRALKRPKGGGAQRPIPAESGAKTAWLRTSSVVMSKPARRYPRADAMEACPECAAQLPPSHSAPSCPKCGAAIGNSRFPDREPKDPVDVISEPSGGILSGIDWGEAASALSRSRAEELAHWVSISIADLEKPDLSPEYKLSSLKLNITRLEEVSPNHPLLPEAVATLKDYLANRFLKELELPKSTPIGSLEQRCPYCRTELQKFPAKATTCKECGKRYFARTRPLDERKVILKEEELAALEEEWVKDYRIRQRKPREPDPAWEERFRLARETEFHKDPEVEAAAREAFQYAKALTLAGTAPRDATERAIEKFGGAKKKEVEIRLWQLQVRSISGA
jgi:hypothetical protein